MIFALIFRHANRQLYAPHCQNIYRLPVYRNFNYLTKGNVIVKNVFDLKCVSISSTTRIWNVSPSKENSARYCHDIS